MTKAKLLSNIRVLDLSRVLAGPLAAQMLGDLGAEVIKVERPDAGDDARLFGPPFLKDRNGNETHEGPMYLSANRNKKSITINIAVAAGQDLFRALAAISDVIIENYKVDDLSRYGLDYASIRKVNPRIIYCSVTGFGQTGPYRGRPGYDPIFQAMSGLMSVTGHAEGMPGSGPMKVGPSIIDIITALYASNAVQAALYHRDANHGEGQHIDMALLDCGIAALSHSAMQYLISGAPPARMGTAGNGGAPGGGFRCADGDIMVAPGNNKQYQRFVEVLGSPELATDPRFLTNPLRVKNRREITQLVQDRISQWRVLDLAAALDAVGVPASPINDLGQVFADEHVRHRGMQVTAPHRLAGSMPLIANPMRFSETPIENYQGPPVLGEHTEQVLKQLLGLDESELEKLRSAGAI